MACAQATEDFGKQLDALDVYVVEGNKSVRFTVETRLSKIEFVHTLKGMGICPKSTLYARLYPLKNQSAFFHLHELAREGDFRCTYFPCIESAQRMEACFASLSGILEEYLPALEDLAMDTTAYDAAVAEKQQAILRCANIKPEKVPTDPEKRADFWTTWTDFYETFAQLAFFTNYAGYTAFLRGDLEKARRLYGKRAAKGDLLPYEQRLYAFLATPAAPAYQPLSPDCAGLLENQSYSNGGAEGKLLFVTGSVCYWVAMAVEWLIIGLVYLLCGSGTAYYPLDWVFYFILPLLPAVFGSVALRRLFIPLVFRKDSERMADIDRLANGKKVSGVAWALTVLMTAAFLFFSFVFIAATPRFYADHLVYDDAAKFPLLNPVSYAYEDIERVCYIEERWNVYDELVERGSYVLFFTNDRVLDLDGVLTEEQTVKRVLPLLEPYVDDEVEVFASDRELAEAYGTTPENLFAW